MTGALRGHDRIDWRSLALHRAIAEKLADPSLLAIAFDNLDRWSKERGRSQPYRTRGAKSSIGLSKNFWRRWSKNPRG
jgi:hypothetical protein